MLNEVKHLNNEIQRKLVVMVPSQGALLARGAVSGTS